MGIQDIQTYSRERKVYPAKLFDFFFIPNFSFLFKISKGQKTFEMP